MVAIGQQIPTFSPRPSCPCFGGSRWLHAAASGRVAQSVEQLTFNQLVAGSSPAPFTTVRICRAICAGAPDVSLTSGAFRIFRKIGYPVGSGGSSLEPFERLKGRHRRSVRLPG